MNSAKTLYAILNVIIFLLLIGIGLGIFVLAMVLFGVEQDLIGLKHNALVFKTERMLYVFTFLELGVYAAFVVALWRLRKATKLLLKNDFYNGELIKSMFNSGKLMVLSSIALWLIDEIGNMFYKRQVVLGLSEKTLVYLLIIAMGLFLMLMSTVLRETKVIKEENDLTI
ncbi:DUF2975 domain-containing protein [Winogradskyella echinorum]|uniref:DUF2975 domain-containing protein n=1 Tax=Winogradskyella echinorum TaxID=538189 RepID=A0ABR6XYG3_9FLAO|nr:DUF2975 domain-containing protein [Winogradskyella echinorum]MBC3845542.1 DUF2975 domain-containing protein [Winogradskyella echinorum]MBC5749890.1 DUF2975 domain-containing protein [Winogradskyella echinorum]